MVAPLVLPRLTWGPADAPRRALLVHGLGSSGALMWRLGTALADAGWVADAVDLRGHGRSVAGSAGFGMGPLASDVVDVLELDGALISRLRILYDTAPLRADFERSRQS